ncbi:MAG TPA: tetraacyldisaccharide 4'-kinase [Gemmatimonadaceae bacterium]|nr:tetraacyldisaccharide 4'-kinase [Gemmatimonadaceae bacterium]
MSERASVERLWFGRNAVSRLARAALMPAELLYGGVTAVRGALYDSGVLRSHPLALPAISVGNLSVGGTGKTPIAAELARLLRRMGGRPAIVLRGYGADEPLVHARLNPGVVVVVSADRVVGAERARALGADVAVLDDAFQHRRARRDADVVLVSADRWMPGMRHLLPAGPWREPMGALRRAALVLITRKAAPDAVVAAAVQAAQRAAAHTPVGVVRLAPGHLQRVGSTERQALGALRGMSVLAVSAIGDPSAFVRQLTALGARVVPVTFPDHHRFTPADVRRVERDGDAADLVVCTLKDAVKLEPLWAAVQRPLWYVSQSVSFERGEDLVSDLLERTLERRFLDT